MSSNGDKINNKEAHIKNAKHVNRLKWILGIALAVFVLSYGIYSLVVQTSGEYQIKINATELKNPKTLTRDFIREGHLDDSHMLFISSFDSVPDKELFYNFKVVSAYNIGEDSVLKYNFSFPRDRYVLQQFSYTDRAWHILLTVNLGDFPVCPDCPLTAERGAGLCLPFSLCMDKNEYRVFLELAIQAESKTDGLVRQFVSYKELNSSARTTDSHNASPELMVFPFNGFVLDATYQPSIDVAKLPPENERFFSSDHGGRLRQYQIKLIFADPIAEKFDSENYDYIFSPDRIKSDDRAFLDNVYLLANDERILSKKIKTADMIRVAAISHVAGLDSNEFGDASGSFIMGDLVWQKLSIGLPSGIMFYAGLALLALLLSIAIGIRMWVSIKHKRQSLQLLEESSVPELYQLWCLSPREESVLKLLGEGKSDKDIATELTIKPKTVSNIMVSVRKKAACKSRAELISILGGLKKQ